MNFKEPSAVQNKAIEPMIKGKDILVQAPTGTGKTAAFSIPILENAKTDARSIKTVILCPTRELAMQTVEVFRQLTTYMDNVRVVALYGGEPIINQIKVLKRHPQIVVATPGRLMDHMNRRTVRLNDVNCVVLDEADCMLDMGFRDDIKTILEKTPEDRQTVLFSATLSDEIKNIAKNYQTDVEQITVEQNSLAVDKVEQFYMEVKKEKKSEELINVLKDKNFGLSLIFVATKSMADRLAYKLRDEGFSADSIHGDLRQKQRDVVMRKYRSGKINILVATDIAARGIDVDGIDAVFNFDVPMDSESYVHRIGRTGRADKTGVAYTFISSRQRGKLKDIVRDTNANITKIKAMPLNSDKVEDMEKINMLIGGSKTSKAEKKAKKSEKGGNLFRKDSRSERGNKEGRAFKNDSRSESNKKEGFLYRKDKKKSFGGENDSKGGKKKEYSDRFEFRKSSKKKERTPSRRSYAY